MGTKVLALGGAGGMGRFAARTASELNAVESVVVADLSESAAREFAGTLVGRAEGIGLDVTDTARLREAMLAADVVLNTTGPFFKLAMPILEMAIECQRHYLDICDDWEPTLDMLALDGEAREAGVTAIVGLGASPGLTNLLSLAAMNELDSVREVYTGWDLGSAVPEEESAQEGVNAAMVHAIQQITGTVKVWRDGDFAVERPLTRVPVDFPGVGRRTTHLFGHPEAITFPHHYPELRLSLNVAHGLDGQEWVLLGLRWLVDQGWVSTARAARFLNWLENLGPGPKPEDFLDPDRLPPIYGLAVGEKDGRPASAAVSLRGMTEVGMGFATGVPLACGLEMLIAGEITERGVMAPESGAIDPHRFLQLLASKEPESVEPGASTDPDASPLLVSHSWDPDVRKKHLAALEETRALLKAAG